MLWVGDYQAAVRLAVDLNPLARSYRGNTGGNTGGNSRRRLPKEPLLIFLYNKPFTSCFELVNHVVADIGVRNVQPIQSWQL